MARKSSRRRNRDGKIWQRASDDRWCARVYPPEDAGGKPRIVYGGTWDEADLKRKKLEALLADGLPGAPDQPLAQWMEHWLAQQAARVKLGKLAPSTLASYTDNAREHILPSLGSIPLRRLSISRVRTWQEELTTKPSRRVRRKLRPGETELPPPPMLSLRTIAYCHAILRAALNDAMREELLTRNVAALVEMPEADDDERKPLTREEMVALLTAIGEDPLEYYWLTVLQLGLRRGEALALRWQDIDFEASSIHIAGTIQRVAGDDGKTTLVRKRTKTRRSRAWVPAGVNLLEILHEQQKAQRLVRMRAVKWLDAGLVFSTSVGTALDPRNVNREWAKICGGAGVQGRIHDLRHACGTYLGNEGVPLKVIATILRHRDTRTTEIYVHALDEATRAAADTMDTIVTDLRKAAKGRS
jgi:integrase